jgi:hypothetical protein
MPESRKACLPREPLRTLAAAAAEVSGTYAALCRVVPFTSFARCEAAVALQRLKGGDVVL